MNLADRTEAIRRDCVSCIDQHLEIARWLTENPNCEKSIRQEKLRVMRKLEEQAELLEKQWNEARDLWIESKRSSAASSTSKSHI